MTEKSIMEAVARADLLVCSALRMMAVVAVLGLPGLGLLQVIALMP